MGYSSSLLHSRDKHPKIIMKQEQEILELIKTNIDKFKTEDEHFDRMFNLGEITDNRGNRQRVWLTFTSTNMKLKNREL
jgi:hypothetical protein